MIALSLGRDLGVKCISLTFALIGALISGCALNEQKSNSLQVDVGIVGYAKALSVEVSSDKKKNLGSASWLSSDLVITASHLFQNMPKGSQVKVGKNGYWLQADVVAIENPEIRDIAILRVQSDKNIQSPIAGSGSVPVCAKQLQPAQEVVVVSEFHHGSSHSYGSPDYVNYHQGASWTDHLTGYYPDGTSGGAIYEVGSGCLAGVVSLRTETHAIGGPYIYTTGFVTAKEISQFLLDKRIVFPDAVGSGAAHSE